MSDTRSAELYRRALHVLPGGVNSPVRAMRAIGRDPIFIERASGAELTDVDGNVYVDYVCSWGPLIHGHAHPEILEAVTDAAARGTSYGAPTAGEVELAEAVCARMPSVDMLRMTSSGTEASMSAIRLARAATGREKLLKFAGAYHGHVDGLLAAGGSGLATQGIPSSPGVPEGAAAATIVVPWNDADAVRAAFAEHEFAAVLVEPYPANMGLIPPAPGFLELLRDLCTGYDALLVFDEVITGFRVAPGGAQELTGVLPDLTVMGKIIGGGLPAAAFGGSVALMEQIAPAGDVYQAGTLSGNPLAVAAGAKTLALLDEQAYMSLSATTRALADGLREAAGDRPVSVTSTTGLVTVFFAAEPPDGLRERRRLRPRHLRRLVSRAARPRRLSARLAVRGLVPVHRPHRRTPRPHGRGGRRGLRGGAYERRAATARPGAALRGRHPRRARSPTPTRRSRTATPSRARARTIPCWSKRSARATCSTTPRAASSSREDPDLALLAGDRLYALGLERLAAIGDLEAVAELADVIALCAQAHAEGDPARAEAVWDAGARAVATGPSPDHEATKRQWRGA